MTDHVGVGEVDDPERRVRPSRQAETNAAAASGALISGLWSYVGTSRGEGTSSRSSPSLRRLLAAVEEVRHVRVLLGLGHVELASPVAARSRGSVVAGRSGGKATG